MIVSSIFLGIAGGSCSGKTTLVRALVEHSSHTVSTLAFDSYYCDQSNLPLEDRALVNYDHPDSLDVDLFIKDLRILRSGKPIASPVYDMPTHTRSASTTNIEATELVIIDGILLFVFPVIVDLLDIKVFVDANHNIRSARRVVRDVAERGRTAEQARAQFLRTVQPMHEKFVEPSKCNADLIINGEADPKESAKRVEEMI